MRKKLPKVNYWFARSLVLVYEALMGLWQRLIQSN